MWWQWCLRHATDFGLGDRDISLCPVLLLFSKVHTLAVQQRPGMETGAHTGGWVVWCDVCMQSIQHVTALLKLPVCFEQC